MTKSDGFNQFFVTQVAGDNRYSDLSIITLPSGSPGQIDNDEIDDLVRYYNRTKTDNGIGRLRLIDLGRGQPEILTEVIATIVFAQANEASGEGMEGNAFRFSENVLNNCQLPILNSPLSGATLAQLVASSASPFVIRLIHADLDVGHVAMFFVVVGGTRIIIGASNGIALALEHGLQQVILKWMKVDSKTKTQKKKKTSKSA